ncbi:transcriptional adapter 2-beta-like [Rhopilema esculentum]|uniref:transcriptional adapter 2-beta-like n=1 Tax=Rhopilema esculentum TaxID=499914 RepID=UPI0031E1A195
MDGMKYHCDVCLADCSGLRIRCADCADFDLCLQCFSSGSEMGDHKKDHGYQIFDNGTFPVLSEDWTAEEEILLLDGVEQHGYGNWDDIADHISTKTPEESKEHYDDMFLTKNIGKVTVARGLNDISDHTLDNGELAQCLANPPEALELPVAEQQELGYMPNRDDFEREYENDAEQLIRSLACNRDDDELETSLKIAHVDMYWRILKERVRRKSVARNYGLITSKHKLIASRRKLSKDDRDFKDKVRVFGQLISFPDWDEFISNRIREKEVKSRIKELSRYRKSGIKKLNSCQEFDDLRFKREKVKENRRKMHVTSPPRTTKVSGNKKNSTPDEEKAPVKASNDQDFLSETLFKDSMKNDTCYQLLSDKEKQLCCSLKMKCTRYVTIKGILLKDYVARKHGIQSKTRYPPNLTKQQRRTIVEFLNEAGWTTEQKQ